ncbi:MAG TPA: rod shape-determining protein MreC [Candidatus Avidehalobacter gallistercoris]|uniref:Cell shape-determining protein MreC n=1 Tax=Candidatus Avidehalobacter gallistercoris TaxID=2840694 RepID=A0A9D1HM78_9FIRM|nr:rod shape-determining protein MreC [Candidatus Avidehalobacter gallistercoris]
MTPKRKKILIGTLAGVLVLALLFLAGLTSTERENISKPEQFLRDMLAPLQNGASVVSGNIRNWGAYLQGVDNIRAENDELRKEISELRLQLVDLAEYQQENERLRDLLNMAENVESQFEYVTTTVVNRSQSSWYKTLVISGGEDAGFAVGMPVVSAQGLVGRIINTSENTAEVLLITDREGAISAMVQNTRTVGVVEGDGETSELSMIRVPYDAEIENYQQIITSGYGGVYPKGLLVGYINSITLQSDGLMLDIDVRSYVDFNRLEEVMVLKPKA